MGLQLSGSVQLEGNLLVTGSANSVFENILVSGKLTTQEIETQLVSSSIIYSSGSNKFGDEAGDVHQFTGSVDVSGSLDVGGVGTFAGSVATGGNITVTANSAAVGVTESGGADVRMVAGGSSGFFGTYSNHPLIFLTNSENKLTLSTPGNLGLGVTSSAWFSDRRALQIQSGGSINGSASTPAFVELGANFFHGSLGDTYIASSQATKYRQVSGAHEWYTAPSGTSNTAINFTSSMSLTAAGNLGINSPTTNNEKLVVRQTIDNTSSVGFYTTASLGTSYGPIILAGSNASDASLRVLDQSGVSNYFYVRGDGNTGIGTDTPVYKLDINSTTSPATIGLKSDATFNSIFRDYTASNTDTYLDITTERTDGGGFNFLLLVSSTLVASGAFRNYYTFAVQGRGTTATATQLSNVADTNNPSRTAIAVSFPSNGVIRLTLTGGETCQIKVTAIGHGSA
jgi:hypothetical protein